LKSRYLRQKAVRNNTNFLAAFNNVDLIKTLTSGSISVPLNVAGTLHVCQIIYPKTLPTTCNRFKILIKSSCMVQLQVRGGAVG
jgi:hypothetical protein